MMPPLLHASAISMARHVWGFSHADGDACISSLRLASWLHRQGYLGHVQAFSLHRLFEMACWECLPRFGAQCSLWYPVCGCSSIFVVCWACRLSVCNISACFKRPAPLCLLWFPLGFLSSGSGFPFPVSQQQGRPPRHPDSSNSSSSSPHAARARPQRHKGTWPLQVRRPNNYDMNVAVMLGPTEPDPTMDLTQLDIVKTVVQDSPDKLFIGGLPCDWSEDQVRCLAWRSGHALHVPHVKTCPPRRHG
jgi:hypothetical protein